MLKKIIYKLNVEVLGTLVIVVGLLSLFGYVFCAFTDNKYGDLIYFSNFLFNIIMISLVRIRIHFNKQDKRERKIKMLNEVAIRGEELEVELRYNYLNKLKNSDEFLSHILNFIEEEELIKFYASLESQDKVKIALKTNDGKTIRNISCSIDYYIKLFM